MTFHLKSPDGSTILTNRAITKTSASAPVGQTPPSANETQLAGKKP